MDDGDWLDGVRDLLDTSWSRLSREAPALDDVGRQLAECAPNAIEWVVSARWCNAPSCYEYWGQYQLIRDFFELRCPLCNEGGIGPGELGNCWGKTRAQLEDEVLLRWNSEYQEDVCPRCRVTRSELIESARNKGYNTFNVIVGQRAGKSVAAGLIGTYIEHRMITLGLSTPSGLHGYLDVTPTDIFEVTYLAATDVQSADTIWAKYASLRESSPWFQRYVPWVKEQELLQVVPQGMKPWHYRETDKRIVNLHPRIRLISNSLNSNAPGLRGRTRPAAFADEISHMQQTESRQSATEIYRALERSLRTVRSNIRRLGGLPWLGLMGSVSSPVSREDKGMQLLKAARTTKRMYVCHMATWNFNPNVTREDLDDEFARDPVGARRDYGAEPPGADFPLVHNETRWRAETVDFTLQPTAAFEIYHRLSPTGQAYVAARLAHANFVASNLATQRYIVWDAGQKFDAFAGACAHAEMDAGPDGEVRIITVFDWVVRILPLPGTEVYFDSVRDVMEGLRRTMRIARCEFDRWQSVQLIQQVRELGIFAEQKSTTDKDYLQWRTDCYSGLCRMLPPASDEFIDHPEGLAAAVDSGASEQRLADMGATAFFWTKEPPELSAPAVAIYELLGLQCNPDTHKVTAPDKGAHRGFGSNDVAQCIVHAHTLVQESALGYTQQQDDRSRRAARVRAEANGAAWGDRGTLLRTSATGRRAPGMSGGATGGASLSRGLGSGSWGAAGGRGAGRMTPGPAGGSGTAGGPNWGFGGFGSGSGGGSGGGGGGGGGGGRRR